MENTYVNTDGQNKWFGKHILLDIFDLQIENGSEAIFHIKNLLKQAAKESGARILETNFHTFDGGGFTGIIVLQESHISIHTWPEENFASIDIYMCGDSDPIIACNYIIEKLRTEKYKINIHKRGYSEV